MAFTKELRELLSVSDMRDPLTVKGGLNNPLLFSATIDTEDRLLVLWVVPSVLLNPLLDPGDGFEAVCTGGAFAADYFNCSGLSYMNRPI